MVERIPPYRMGAIVDQNSEVHAQARLCPKCKTAQEAGTEVCPNCGHSFGLASGDKVFILSIVSILIAIVAFMVFGMLIKTIPHPLTPNEKAEYDRLENAADALDAEADNAMDAAAAEADAQAGIQPPGSPWTYRSTEDKVRGGTSYFAETTSTNSVNLNFPYGGGSTVALTVRRAPAWGLDVVFKLSSGQLVCNSNRDCHATVRFDQGPAQRFSLNEASDHSNDVVFVNADHQFLAKLKKAKKLVVELEIYEGGRPQFEFNVSGLEWAH